MQRFAQVLATFLGAMAFGLAAMFNPLPAAAQATQASNSGGVESNITLPATESILYNFGVSATDGFLPQSGLMQASDGNFYGTTPAGGANGYGIFYRLTPSGQETILHNFTGLANDGEGPSGSTPIEASDGNLYGVAKSAGPNGYGAIYQYNLKTGVFAMVYFFQNADGANPWSGLIDDGKGFIYGTAVYGGSNNAGSVWSFNYLTNTFKTLHSFTNGNDGGGILGDSALEQALVLATDGNLYGTSYSGGANGYGTAFMLGTDGSNFQVIHQFTGGADGGYPGDLVQYSDGKLYGVSNAGGSDSLGTFFQIVPNGVSSSVNTLYSFTPPADGYSQGFGHPFIGGDGKFYVVGTEGGPNFSGQVMQLDNLGNKADVYDFNLVFYNMQDPGSNVLESTDGNLYGITKRGGIYTQSIFAGVGTAYRLATALPPVITLASSADGVDAGKSVTLSWAANSVYSKNDQVCVAYSSDGTWSGVVAPSGSATVTPAGPNTVNYAVTCAGVETATVSVVVGSSVPLAITTASLPNGVAGSAYYQALAATGGTPPYKWSLQSGTLPQGLTLVSATGPSPEHLRKPVQRTSSLQLPIRKVHRSPRPPTLASPSAHLVWLRPVCRMAQWDWPMHKR